MPLLSVFLHCWTVVVVVVCVTVDEIVGTEIVVDCEVVCFEVEVDTDVFADVTGYGVCGVVLGGGTVLFVVEAVITVVVVVVIVVAVVVVVPALFVVVVGGVGAIIIGGFTLKKIKCLNIN